ncbi:MAG TPA: choline/ethanolamine kinase family protein [Devosia sp.]|nr:choline/ethanolamine kinase family protein [Devosia sp.]
MPDIEGRIAALPIWSGPVALAPLTGGISNLSFTATDDDGKYVVRITRDFPFHHVFRDREVMVSRAAYAAGFGPEIIHAEPGLMVSRFVEGKVLASEDVRADIPRIADLVYRFHRDMAAGISGPGFIFWVFHVNRDYLHQLREAGHAEEPLGRWLAINAELEAAQTALPIVVGHHDLLPANLIDDGKRLWLIDYEYAGFDTGMFDLANLSSNNGFSPGQSQQLLDAYFGRAPAEEMLRSHAAMECASLLREALWSLVSVPHLDRPGVDYAAYAHENFVKLDAALQAYRSHFGGATA